MLLSFFFFLLGGLLQLKLLFPESFPLSLLLVILLFLDHLLLQVLLSLSLSLVLKVSLLSEVEIEPLQLLAPGELVEDVVEDLVLHQLRVIEVPD